MAEAMYGFLCLAAMVFGAVVMLVLWTAVALAGKWDRERGDYD